jgi:hypothetical protein
MDVIRVVLKGSDEFIITGAIQLVGGGPHQDARFSVEQIESIAVGRLVGGGEGQQAQHFVSRAQLAAPQAVAEVRPPNPPSEPAEAPGG